MSGPQLNELPDDAEQLGGFVRRLRRSALRSGELPAAATLSDGFLLKFLRARDFDVELSLKVLRLFRENKSVQQPAELHQRLAGSTQKPLEPSVLCF